MQEFHGISTGMQQTKHINTRIDRCDCRRRASGNTMVYTTTNLHSGERIKIRIGKGGKGAYIDNNQMIKLSRDKKLNCPEPILIIIGGIFSALVLVISTALVTMRHTRDQFWIYCIASLAAFGLSWILVKQSSVFGACLSYMLSMML